MTKIRIPSDEEYINEFHKQWNEACMKELERTQALCFSVEYLRAQSKRLDALVKRNELIEMLEGKKRRKKGITDEDINKRIDELLKIITECKEVARKHPPINKNE
jgi:hypothetical protein